MDAAPVGLCLFRPNGTPVAANRPFARLLGYDSAAELLRVADTLGVFGSREEQGRVLSLVERGLERVAGVVFRRKDGTRQAFGVIGSARDRFAGARAGGARAAAAALALGAARGAQPRVVVGVADGVKSDDPPSERARRGAGAAWRGWGNQGSH